MNREERIHWIEHFLAEHPDKTPGEIFPHWIRVTGCMSRNALAEDIAAMYHEGLVTRKMVKFKANWPIYSYRLTNDSR